MTESITELLAENERLRESADRRLIAEGYELGWKAAFESTRERCAQVADKYANDPICENLAAAIRALEDKK